MLAWFVLYGIMHAYNIITYFLTWFNIRNRWSFFDAEEEYWQLGYYSYGPCLFGPNLQQRQQLKLIKKNETE